MAVGLPLVEGHGLTEGGILALNSPDRPKVVGRCLPGVEARVAEEEWLFRGPRLFSGYYKDAEATTQGLREGRLTTADLAEMDEEGYIHITGRKKGLIVISSGRKIYPAHIERLFKAEPIVSQVRLVGDRHS